MVSGSLRISIIAVLALMLVPLSGCVDAFHDDAGDPSDPVVQEGEEDDAEVATRGAEDATASPTAEPRPTTATEDAASVVTRVPATTTPAGGVTPVSTAPPTSSPTPVTNPTHTPTPTPITTATPTPTSTATEDPVTPEEDEDEWPREDSFVRYRTTGGGSSPGGEFSSSQEAEWHMVYWNGTWNGTCTWSHSERVRHYDAENDTYRDEWTNTSGTETIVTAPPEGPTDVTVGDIVEVPYLVDCQESVFDALTVEKKTVHSAPRQSDGSPSWYGYWDPEWPADAYAYWETESGLVLAWRDQRTNSYDDGWMVDTDAPLG